jgi:hypothetical protein
VGEAAVALYAYCAFVLFQQSARPVGEAAVALYAYLLSFSGVDAQSVKRLLRYMFIVCFCSLSAECTPSR